MEKQKRSGDLWSRQEKRLLSSWRSNAVPLQVAADNLGRSREAVRRMSLKLGLSGVTGMHAKGGRRENA